MTFITWFITSSKPRRVSAMYAFAFAMWLQLNSRGREVQSESELKDEKWQNKAHQHTEAAIRGVILMLANHQLIGNIY